MNSTRRNGAAIKTFAAPDFGPHLVTLDLQPDGKAIIRDLRPLTRPDGVPISGLPNSLTTPPATDVPYDFKLNQLPYDEDSLDAEGVTIDPWGNFWLSEDHKPSSPCLWIWKKKSLPPPCLRRSARRISTPPVPGSRNCAPVWKRCSILMTGTSGLRWG
ncbi:MAG: hypothetical protein O3C21_03510 [Verrucomicrobia bacterium]|nr:hypothetical protein [Verrucomicrobiota bacterium]